MHQHNNSECEITERLCEARATVGPDMPPPVASVHNIVIEETTATLLTLQTMVVVC